MILRKYIFIEKEAKIVKARDTLDVALYCWRFQRLA